MPENRSSFDPYRKWLGISSKQRPLSHYDLLGIASDETDADVIEATHQQRRAFVESQRGLGQDEAVSKVLFQLDEAKLTLLDRELRRDYDQKLSQRRKQSGRRRKSRAASSAPGRGGSELGGLPPRVGGSGSPVGEGSDFLRTYGGVVAILTIAFGVMLWWSFRQPWSQPPAVADADRPNVLFDGINGEEQGVDDGEPDVEVGATEPADQDAPPSDQPHSAAPPLGRYLVSWIESSGSSGQVEYEFKPDRSVWKAGRLIGVLGTVGSQHTINFSDSARGQVTISNLTPNSFEGRHTWASGRTSVWVARRVDDAPGGIPSDSGGWVSIFNGRDLGGWSGDRKHWTVDGGRIRGRSTEKKPVLLIYDQPLRDFALRMKFQHRRFQGNSGIFFRSVRSSSGGGLAGPQIEIADKRDNEGRGFYGGVFQSGGFQQGWNPAAFGRPDTTVSRWIAVTPPDRREALLQTIRNREYSDLLLEVRGTDVRVVINGIETVLQTLPTIPSEGYVALQMLCGEDDRTSMAFMDIELRTLD